MLLHIQEGFNVQDDDLLWSPEPLLKDVTGSLVARSAQRQTTDGRQGLATQQLADVGELRYIWQISLINARAEGLPEQRPIPDVAVKMRQIQLGQPQMSLGCRSTCALHWHPEPAATAAWPSPPRNCL